MKLIFPDRTVSYNLRYKNPFLNSNIKTVANGTETISFRGPKIWAQLPEEIRKSKSLIEFKAKFKKREPTGCTCRLCKVYISNVGFI